MQRLYSPLIALLAFASSTFVASAADTPKADRPPNIVFIMADDLGWTDLSCQGSKYYETPAIDRLAADSVRFQRHHHCQNCAPTRAAIMSGQSPPRTGVYTVSSLERGTAAERSMNVPQNVQKLPLDRKTIADQLKAAGYATGLFGKWHLGQTPEYHPSKRGFDEAIVSNGQHFDFATQPQVEVPKGAYLADFLTDRAVDFIQRHKDQPFFLYLPHFGVHSPHQAKRELIDKFKDKPAAGGHHDPTYAAMIASIDQSVDRIREKLSALKLADNTIVIFTSDNGGVGGYAEINGKGITDNAPLRGGKGMLYEGGVRVPLFIHRPGDKPGFVSTPTQHIDLYTTLLEFAGAPKPPQKIDGVSLVPLLKDPSATLPREAIFAHFPGYLEGYGSKQWRTKPVATAIAGNWKLVTWLEDDRKELYNLATDVGEKKNVAAEQADKVADLSAKLAAWQKETGAAMPTPKTAEQRKRDAESNEPAIKKKGKKADEDD